MLALTRKKDESIIINAEIEVKVLEIQGDKVKLGITAPKEVAIHREEVYRAIKESNKNASLANTSDLEQLNFLLKK